MTEVTTKSPRTSKGGTFSPADIPLLKRALLVLISSEGVSHDDAFKAGQLLHRLGRIDQY